MKKPAAKASAKSKVKNAALKRPASSLNAIVQSMQKGVSAKDMEKENGGDKGAEKTPDSDQEQDGRDKSKGQKYVKMRHQLPDHVVDLIEKESLKCSSPRDFKTTCINRLFKRSGSGKLVLNLDDAMFTEHKKVYGKRYAGEEDTALPELVMRGLYFGNNQDAMNLAKDRGEIQPVDVGGGKTYWSFTKFVKGQEHGSLEEQTLKTSKKVNKQEAKLLGDAFEMVGWTWKYLDKDVKAIADGKTIPQPILQLVKQATESQQRLAREAMSMIKGWKFDKNDEKLTKLKKGHAVTTQNLAKLAHMKEFNELPDELDATKENLDKIMLDMAKHTKDYNLLVETTRGYLRAQAK